MIKVYKHTSQTSGKSYVGITGDMDKRVGRHQQPGCVAFYRAIQKYGWSDFVTEVLEEVETPELALEREAYYIRSLNTLLPTGYNMKISGEYPVLCEEARAKISASNRNRVITDQMRTNMSAAQKGKLVSNETRAKLSEMRRGRKQSAEHTEARQKALVGHTTSDEARAKMSATRKGRTALNKGQPRSEETKRKISETKRLNKEKKLNGSDPD